MKPICQNLALVQTTDFFYPLVDDPYLQGRIACANVLSDLYAMGVERCDGLLMLLAQAMDLGKCSNGDKELEGKIKHIVCREMIRGFNGKA